MAHYFRYCHRKALGIAGNSEVSSHAEAVDIKVGDDANSGRINVWPWTSNNILQTEQVKDTVGIPLLSERKLQIVSLLVHSTCIDILMI